MKKHDVVVIGSGPAGLTCALYLARANKKVLVIEGIKGGQLTTTSYVENFPGFVKPILGVELMDNFYNQCVEYGVEFACDFIVDFEKKDEIFVVKGNVETYFSKALVIATGSSPKFLGIEEKFLAKGVSTCATCDGNFFKNKVVAVVGGGNTALEDSLYLSNIASKAFLIHRGTSFKGEQILQERVKQKENIEIMWPYKVVSFNGNSSLEHLIVENLENNKTKQINVSGAFIAIGHVPNNQLLLNKVAFDENGYVLNAVKTEIKGLFVAGDVHDSKFKQAVVAAGFGCMCALECIKFLETSN